MPQIIQAALKTIMLGHAEIVTDMELFAKMELGITGGTGHNI